ncbi:MAG: hypothetical protein OEZ38_01175 [Gammaproteobacteria bacterium]|nr:hypothetical protein [Gammaproteobacteria bacterium]
MKHLYLAFTMSILALITGCSSDNESGSVITVTIDSQNYNFGGCGTFTASTNEFDISCLYQSGGEAKRLFFYKIHDIDGGEIKVRLTDIPDATQLDSPYGIEYECSTLGSPACLTAALPTFDTATTTITLNNVVMPLTNNRTDYAGGPLVVGPTEHTVSFSIDVSTISSFQ